MVRRHFSRCVGLCVALVVLKPLKHNIMESNEYFNIAMKVLVCLFADDP